jgi:transcriptional regulator with AAA-type ATPase domain/tetratricopeptide (TPR) repeat protein
MVSLGLVLGDSAAVVAVREQVRRLLRSATGPARRLPPILILGDTGTGKGLLASTIHRSSARAAGPFVDVNCSAIPETLLEAELFGFERGAFTDARQAKAGLFQAANGGTMFLDEVGLLPLAMQAKLLKVIEERSVRRLGSTRSEPLDVSVIAATSEDVPAAVQAGRFRADLYHRLAVVTLTLPPLRARGRDVVLLAEHFLASICEDYGLPLKVLSEDGQAALTAYRWPGNVRELANVLERAVLLSDGPRLTAAELALPHTAAPPAQAGAGATASDEEERRQLLELLEATAWNFSRAAVRLGVPRNTLRYRADRLGLAGPLERRRGGRPRTPREPLAPAPRTAPAEPQRERRRLTFLEARLVTDSAAGAPWELSRSLDATVEKVRSFGGRIEESSPHGVVALFGLEPDEDAPRRAAHAAIAVQKLAARAQREDARRPGAAAALHTASLALVRVDDRVELDADARQHARRTLQAALECAAPGTVVASAAASRFLRRRFELVRLDGEAGAAPAAWQVVRAAEPGRSRFVGRQQELRLLFERFERAHAGRGQLVMLVGEPGVGKSRLVHEFRRQLGATATWVEGQALSFGRAMAFHPVIDMVKRVFRIDDGDPEAVVVEKVNRGVRRLGDDLSEVLPFLRYLLAVDPGDPAIFTMDPRLRHAQIVRATHLLFERGAELSTHVLVLEDAHWADPATEDWISRLAEGVGAKRAFILVTTRPGYRPPFGHLTFHTALALSTLSNADTVRIAADLIGADQLPPALQTLILDKADGNPFFVEELVRSLQELNVIQQEGHDVVVAGPLAEALLPDTIQDVILARIERLADEPRRVLRMASVIGREFTRSVLGRVAESSIALDGALRELTAVGLIHERRLFPEVEYAFKHALTHEVAYASVPAEDRRALHRRIAQSVEALQGDRLTEMAPLLARHYSAAEDWEQALGYLVRAADSAAKSFATREALALYDEALQAAARMPGAVPATTVMAIHQAKSNLYFVLSDFAQSYAAAASLRDIARDVGNRAQEGVALAAQAWAATWARDLTSAVAHAREAIALATPIAADTVLARAYFTVGFVQAVTGGIAEGKAAIADALAASRSAGDRVHQSLALTVAGCIKSWEGEYREADRLQLDGLTVARQHNLLVPLLFNAFLRGLTLAAKGDYGTALVTFEEGLALSEKVGDEAIHHRLLNCLGWLHFELGDLDRAAELNMQSAVVGRRRGDDGTMANAEINLGDVFLAQGDLASAAEILDGVERMAGDVATSPWMRFRYSNRLWASLGELALAQGDLDRARARARQCLELATQTNARKNLVKGWRLSGAIASAAHRWDEAHDALNEALAVAKAIGNPTQLWHTYAALGHYHAQRGQNDAAHGAYRAARAVIEGILAGLPTPRLRESLESLPVVRDLTRRALM